MQPRNVLKWRATDYLQAVNQYIYDTTGDLTQVYLVSVHGEDGGTGILTEVIFLTGGQEAARNFRENVLTDWDKVQEMLPADKFGKGHVMRLADWCLLIFLF